MFPALLDRLGSGRGCRCSRGQCDAPVGVLAYGAVCAPRVDVGALLAGTPQGGMCCLRRHRHRRRLVSRSTGGRRPKAANKIRSPTTTARGWLLRKCQRRKQHHDSRAGHTTEGPDLHPTQAAPELAWSGRTWTSSGSAVVVAGQLISAGAVCPVVIRAAGHRAQVVVCGQDELSRLVGGQLWMVLHQACGYLSPRHLPKRAATKHLFA